MLDSSTGGRSGKSRDQHGSGSSPAITLLTFNAIKLRRPPGPAAQERWKLTERSISNLVLPGKTDQNVVSEPVRDDLEGLTGFQLSRRRHRNIEWEQVRSTQKSWH